jgi:phosphatidylserine decarboxylase
MVKPLRLLSQHERLNFLLTNRIPRRALTRFMGWLSRIESPILTRMLIGIWRRFAEDLRLEEAETQRFESLQACFTRRLRPGARPIDGRGEVIVSPCDAEIGQCGRIQGRTVFQAKGFPYELDELMPDARLQQLYEAGTYVTLRLKSSMYHRFHAPVRCTVREIQYISGDTWNVNHIALRRIERLFCRNERAVVPLAQIATSGSLCLVPIAAILVASLRFHGVESELNLRYRGPNRIACDSVFEKGEEMGYFQHGSTILVFATANYRLVPDMRPGQGIRMGEPLLLDTNSNLNSG